MSEDPLHGSAPAEQEPAGYGHPPVHTRFKPGQSGNPAGRPRGKRNMTSLLGDVLAQKVTVTSNGKRKRIRSDTAILLRLREKALAGDLRAAAMLMSLRAVHLPDREGEWDSRNWAAEDRAILASFGLLEPAGGSDDPL